MAMAQGWERVGGASHAARSAEAPGAWSAAPAGLLERARDRWAELSDLLGGVSGLVAVLAVTALLSPLLTFGMVVPLIRIWQPAAAAASFLMLPVVWLLTSAWVLLGAVRR